MDGTPTVFSKANTGSSPAVMAARSVGTLKSLYMKIEKEKNLIIAIVKRHGALDFLKPARVYF